MKIQEVIDHLESQGTWVDWDQTRDFILYGDSDREINKMGVCWVATVSVIEKAIHEDINFIISHENPFYQSSTSPKTFVRDSIELKKDLLNQGNITIYRSHDVWDKFPEYGVADQWAKRLGFPFTRDISSYLQFADIQTITLGSLAKQVANALTQDGENGVYVIGDLDRNINHISMGTGAATDIFAMLKKLTDVLIVSDDGITNYYQMQYAIDNDIAMIVVNHSSCEICGLKAMETYFKNIYPDLSVQYLEEGYNIQYILADIES